MGWQLSRQIKAVKCDHTTNRRSACETRFEVYAPVEMGAQIRILADLVREGWAVNFHPRIRAFCPMHAADARKCTCSKHSRTKQWCPVHATPELVWDATQTPEYVQAILELNK